MASSEIDAIFASKHKPGATQESVSSISNQPVKSRKKDKKSKRDPKPLKPDLSVIHDPEKIPNPSKKRPAPETIIDPSVHVASVKRQKCPSTPKGAKPGGRTKNQELDAGGNFNDSRGSTSRKKTEEGWAVYKEDELGIGDQGGDTPLCPFDCDCCEFCSLCHTYVFTFSPGF
ncbi:hypothetical protein BD779DRAFT_1687491 [Infundibulicybe gibba]|nr:hypothetical protein BD779DRAFT_1687491 [Infundibulicybe gibba]